MKKEISPKELLDFFITIEELKNVMRHSWTSNPNRQESTAEHSWMLAFMAVVLFDYLPKHIDKLKTLKLVLFHDVAEIVTSDIPAFEVSQRQNNKQESERKALEILYKNLPEKQKKEFISLWEEYEAKETLEAKVAQALDKMEVVIQHNIADFSTWDQGDFSIQAFYRTNYFDFDLFMRKLRDEVEFMTIKKVVEGNNTHRIAKEHQKTFKKLYTKHIKSKK